MMRKDCNALKFSGSFTLVVSYQLPKPFCASSCQGKYLLGSTFLLGAISECPIKFAVGILLSFFNFFSNVSKLLICGSVKDSKPLLSNSIPILLLFTSVRLPHLLLPACHALK